MRAARRCPHGRQPCVQIRPSKGRQRRCAGSGQGCSPTCSRFRLNLSAMLASMNSAGLPTTVGSRLVEPAPNEKMRWRRGFKGGGGGGGGGGGERQRERTCSGLAGSCGQARAWSTACPSTPGAPSMPCTATPPPTRPPTHRGSRRPCCRCPPTPARPSGGSPRLQPARGRARRSDFGGAGCAVLCCEKAARVFTDTARQCFIRLAASLPRSPTQPALHSTAAARAQVHEAHRGWWR